MSILDEYGRPTVFSGPQGSVERTPAAPAASKRGPKGDVEPWAGGAVAAAGRDKQAYEPWAKPAPTPVTAATAVPSSGINPDNINAPGTRRTPDDRGFK